MVRTVDPQEVLQIQRKYSENTKKVGAFELFTPIITAYCGMWLWSKLIQVWSQLVGVMRAMHLVSDKCKQGQTGHEQCLRLRKLCRKRTVKEKESKTKRDNLYSSSLFDLHCKNSLSLIYSVEDLQLDKVYHTAKMHIK